MPAPVAPGTLACSLAVLMVLSPLPARAQDPVDEPAVQDTLGTDADTWQDEDSTRSEPRHPRRPGEPNPYLREVREEHPSRRRGSLWVAGSFGVGGEAIATPGSLTPWGQSRLAPTLSVGLGGTVTQGFRLGLEGFAWFNPDGDVLETVSTVMLTGRVYPFRSNGLFLKSGVGIGRYAVDEIGNCGCSNSTIVSDYGLAWSVGAGFEAPVARGLWIGPMVEVTRMNVTGPDGYRERVVNFGLSLTYDGDD